jgi:hypothetical protein
VDAAIEERRWSTAWDQAATAGASRERLEEIALGALADDDGAAEDMLAALAKKWGGLSPGGRARVRGIVEEAKARGDWEEAARVALGAAEDAPAFADAWVLYRGAPARDAGDVLTEILEARKRHAEETR